MVDIIDIKYLLVIALAFTCVSGIYYDAYTGTEITEQEYLAHVAANTSFWCTNVIEPCDASEYRRLDGSCNNLDNPQRGATHSVMYRLLDSDFAEGYEPRLAASGQSLPLPRKIRTNVLATGEISDTKFTNLAGYVLVFNVADSVSIHDAISYMFWSNCCPSEGSPDADCVPNPIPVDDPVHRFSGLTCFNVTRPSSFQAYGCTANKDTEPERIQSDLPLSELSIIYGGDWKSFAARLNESGLLRYEELYGMHWPPNAATAAGCPANRANLNETRCHDGPISVMNGLIGINVNAIWFWRNHNRIAAALAAINPCWSDDKLFYTARDINIAMYNEIMYYELFNDLIGHDYMVKNKALAETESFRDMYDSDKVPSMGLEHMVALRWFHSMQQGMVEMLRPDGTLVEEFPVVNLTLRTGFLAKDNQFELLTHGAFRQPAAGFDQIVDPLIGDLGIADFQKAFDLTATDLIRGRYYGLAPYVDYVQLCGDSNSTITSFDDLADQIEPQNLKILKNTYEDVRDIELMAGIWAEKPIDGGYIPRTAACLITKHLRHAVETDRHWYERPNRPYAFTAEQLAEIRKSSFSHLLCGVGDSVTEIQPKAFIVPDNDQNTPVSCSKIPAVDLNAWYDSTCQQ